MRGLPAVVSDRGGLPETPEAEVFRARDPPALREAVRRLVETPGLLAERSRALIERREQFLWATHVAEVEQAPPLPGGTSRPPGGGVVPPTLLTQVASAR